MSLSQYRKKRRFDQTGEPNEQRGGGKNLFKYCMFVVQKHSATSLHFDFRLEYKGVLLSWAIPKGFPMDPSQKRLAVKVEDHPLDYGDFEGVIPEGNYGAGTVMLWDRGYYSVINKGKTGSERHLGEELKKGHCSFFLWGQKLHGNFALAKLKNSQNDWILIKKKDKFAGDAYAFDQNSVQTGRSMEEISKGKVSPIPHHIKPMMAHVAREPFDREGWIFEIKWDGYRAIAEIENGIVNLYSRNFKSYNKQFSNIAQNLSNIKGTAILDGEIVVVDEKGKPDFQALQDYKETKKGHLVYYVFDLLYYDGHDLTNKPLIERKSLLKKIIAKIPQIKFSDHVKKNGKALFKVAAEMGIEGIMAKDEKSPYLSGKRSSKWLKIKKESTAEAIIAGYTQPQSGRKYFGSLILGMYDSDKNLQFVGHVGTGFDDEKIRKLFEKFQPLIQKQSPFSVSPRVNAPAIWLKPELVCAVKFSEYTREGSLRQPVFLTLRDDVDPSEVKKDEQTKAV